MHVPILDDREISIAPLELSTKPEDEGIDELFNFHHRKEVAELFYKSPARDIHYSQLFNQAKVSAIVKSKSTSKNPEAAKKCQLTHGNIIGIVGQAGIGKTTLTKQIVNEVLHVGLYHADFIFYLLLRDLDYENNINFLQFLTNKSPFANNLSKENREDVLGRLDESSRVCIICDGFDEAILEDTTKRLTGKCTINDKAKPGTFIKHLLCGKLLPKAKKMFTSRPRQLFELHEDYLPNCIVNVQGLNDESQQQICHDVCENDDICSKKVLDFVKERPDLKSFCHTPANCILVMFCLYENFKSDSAVLKNIDVDSITTILVATVARFFLKHGHLESGEKLQAKNLSFLAYTTFKEKRLVFVREDLVNAGITMEEASTFLNARLDRRGLLKLFKGLADTKSYFSHLLLHEFFVAIYIILFTDYDEFDETLPTFKDNRYEMVTKFVFGLCNSTTQEYLKGLIQSEALNLTDFKEKKEKLKKLALEQVSSAQNFTDLLQTCSWIYELRDDAFTVEAVAKLKEEATVSGNIVPSDIPAFQYVLNPRESPLSLKILHPNLNKESWKSFYKALDEVLESSNVKVIEKLLHF